MNQHWIDVQGLDAIASPGLLIDADRVSNNLNALVKMVEGDVARLRTHVKTHKMPSVIRLQTEAGISRFKTATIAETRMTAEAGGRDILLAYQLVGPNVARWIDLVDRFPDVNFATVADHVDVIERLAAARRGTGAPLRIFIDVDCGMHRTGIPLGDGVDRLRERMARLSEVEYAGLHIYDGHLHQNSLEARKESALEVIEMVRHYDQQSPSPTIVGGGSPTFPFWAAHTDWQCSPGTPLFWDAGYGTAYPDMHFSPAVGLVTRVISKPGEGRLCLDLGYKAIASEMPLDRRVTLPSLPDATPVGQSEEHLVIETARAPQIAVGQALIAVPQHVCPTVALHASATIVRNGSVTPETWPVTARDR